MSRRGTRARPHPAPAPPRPRLDAGPIALAAVTGLLVVALFVVVYPVGGYRVPLGSDTPGYVWWARRAAALGLSAADTGGRPLTVGTMAALSGALGLPVAAVTSAVGPALAAALSLAAAALLHAALGPDRLRFGLAAVLTAGFLSFLVPGYFSTLAFGACFVAALAVLAHGADRPHAATALVAGVLLGAGGAAHPQFLLVGGAILCGAAVALAIFGPTRVPGRGGSLRGIEGTGAVTVAGALAVGAGLTGLGTLAGGPGGSTLDTSRDAAMRRLGLDALVTRSFTAVLYRYFPWWRTAIVLPLAALGLGRPRPDGRPAATLFWGATVTWVLITAAGVAALLAGLGVPGQRLAAFCLPLPLLAAIGLRRRWTRLFPARGGAAAGGALAFVVVTWVAWVDAGPLVPSSALAESRAVAAVLATRPAGTPVILVAHEPGPTPARFVIRHQNYLRAEVPPARVPDVLLFPGRPEDLLAGRPTLTGVPEQDRLATDAWVRIRSALPRDPIAAVLESFDPAAYRRAAALPEVLGDPDVHRPAPGVVVLPGFTGPAASAAEAPRGAGWTELGAGPISPWAPVWLSPVVLLLFGAVGWPWVRAALPSGDTALWAGLAPAFGLAVAGLAVVVLDGVGLRLAGPAGAAPVLLALVAGMFAARRGGGSRGPATA